MHPSVLQKIHEASLLGGNPSSVHRLGQKARRILDEATMVLRQYVNLPKADVTFTSGVEESNALAHQIPQVISVTVETLTTELLVQARAQDIPVHLDASMTTQRLDMAALGVDAITLSSKAIGGPPGVSALITLPGLELMPLWYGGGQERGIRPGTQAVGLIAGFAEACRLAM
jgi:cysteine sulfinate desulfinase/cysteine desulfurase-like protein